MRGASLGLKLRVRILSLLLALLVAGVLAGTLAVGPASAAQVPGCKDSEYLCGWKKGRADGQKDFRNGKCERKNTGVGPTRSEQGYIDGYTRYCPPPSTARAAAASPLPTTGGPPLVGPVTWVATLTLITSGVGALVLLRGGGAVS